MKLLGKTIFHLVGLDSSGRVVVRKSCSRTQLLAFTANLQVQFAGVGLTDAGLCEIIRPR
jgi:hypothetical protein